MNKYKTIPKIISGQHYTAPGTTWDRCDICCNQMTTYLRISIMYSGEQHWRDSSHWVCSEQCFTMWMLKQL